MPGLSTQVQIPSTLSISVIHFGLAIYCLPLFITDHSQGSFNEADAGLSVEMTTTVGLLPRPWKSFKGIWVDEG